MTATTAPDSTSPDSESRIELPPESPPVSPFKLLGTLGLAGALAGLLLVTVHQLTQPAIQAHKAKVLQESVLEVLSGPTTFETLYLVDGALTPELPDGANPRDVLTVYAGRTADGGLDGFAVPAAKSGYQDTIALIFGFDPATGTLRGMKVLASKETPGLGDKIEKDESFTGQFPGTVVSPTHGVVGVKGGASGENEIDMITGATISSRTVIGAINDALAEVRPALEAYAQGGGQ